MKRTWRWISVGALAAMAAAACARVDTTKIGDAEEPRHSLAVPLWEAANAIARARCDRQLRCDGIGPGRAHADEMSCMMDLADEGPDALDDDECHFGIDRPALFRCTAAIQQQSCEAAIDAYESLDVCSEHDVCLAAHE
jgi:uncharacterized protein DUF6184